MVSRRKLKNLCSLYTLNLPLQDMDASEIGSVLRHPAAGSQVAGCVASFPYLTLEAALHPITRTVLRIQLTLTPAFTWKDSVHGSGLKWLVWVEDSDNEKIYHSGGWCCRLLLCDCVFAGARHLTGCCTANTSITAYHRPLPTATSTVLQRPGS